MKYDSFKNTTQLDLKLLATIGAIQREKIFFEINNYPDFDLSRYDKHRDETYFFFHDSPFPAEFSYLVDAEIDEVGIVHWDDLTELEKKYEVEFTDEMDFGDFLNSVHSADPDMEFGSNGTEIDQFCLNNIRIAGIDSKNKTLTFVGGYTASYSGIQPDDWKLIATCHLTGFFSAVTESRLHLHLIAEAYALLNRNDYRLAFFLLYSAIECYVNQELSADDEAGRLKDKVRELFAVKFGKEGLIKNQIYTSLIGDFDSFTDRRNKIAHGRTVSVFEEEECHDFLLFVLVLVASAEMKISSFESLKSALKQIG